MNRLGFISSILNRYSEDNKHRFYQQPDSLEDSSVACWQAWAASRYLEKKGEWQRAISWIAISSDLLTGNESSKETLLRAEVRGLAGHLIYAQGDVGDALPLLVESGTLWNALSESAHASARTEPEVLERLADEIRGMVAAFDPEQKILPEQALVQTKWLVDRWSEECMLDSWSKLAATQGRALAAAGRFKEARAAILAMKDWMRGVYYVPARPESRGNYLMMAEYAIDHGREEGLDLVGLPQTATREQKLAHLRKQIEEMTRGDDKLRITVDAVVPMWRLAMAHGDVEVAGGKFNASVEEFELALRVWDDNVVNYEDLHYKAQALFNQANSYLRLGRYEEARQNYAECIEYFGLYDSESTLRARHADLVARWKLNPQVDVEAEAREMLIEWESLLARKPDQKNLHIYKAAISPLYELMLSLLARRGDPESALDYFDIVRALREGDELTFLSETGSGGSNLGGMEKPVNADKTRSLEVVRTRLPRFPRSVILFVQNGAEELTYLALRSGDEASANDDQRLLNGVVPPELSAVFGELVERQQAELDAVFSGRASEYQPASPEFMECCARAWRLLPEKLLNWLEAAETIIFCPDPFGNLDKVPIELLRTSKGWLSVEHVVTRHFSIGTLLRMLKPDAFSKQPGERAAVVRAEDPAGFVPLPGADFEVDQVMRYFELIGLKGERTEKPEVAKLVKVLDGGYSVLHYCGHGLATSLSEGLPLAAGQTLQPRDLSSLSGSRTPFVYLSACQVGRTRHIPGGRQSGVAFSLIQNGAPAVIGCLHAVPDGLAGLMARSFYRAAKTTTVGEALCIARRQADEQGIHPARWGVYALYGDPSTTISPYAAR